jgi:hypothetical protein
METIKLYKNTIAIEFDEDRHIFKRNGEYVISVTGATGMIDKSQALIGWAIKLMKNFLIEKWDPTKKISEDEKIGLICEAANQHCIAKERARNVGEQAHSWVEEWIKGKNPAIPDDEKVRNCVISFLKWVKDSKIKFISSERKIYSKKYNYAGILDADGKINKKNVIIDFKSSNKNKYNKTGIYNESRYQLAGYWQAVEEESKKKYDRGYIVQFGKDSGEFMAVEIPREEYLKDIKAFLGALAIKSREKQLK